MPRFVILILNMRYFRDATLFLRGLFTIAERFHYVYAHAARASRI